MGTEPDVELDSLINNTQAKPHGCNKNYSNASAALRLGAAESPWIKYGTFAGLLLTTTASLVLVYSMENGWMLSDKLHSAVVANRALVQLLIQVLAGFLGFIQVATICRLILYAGRLRMKRHETSLEMIHFITGLSAKRLDWSVSFVKTVILMVFVVLTAIPAALWAGAITPVAASTLRQELLNIPQYNDMSSIKIYHSQVLTQAPVLRTKEGIFTYSVAMKYLGQLLSSAATGTPTNNTRRRHTKFDNSGFTFVGRSYGVGASIGLMDASFTSNNLVQTYSYQEDGYEPIVDCIYNHTASFVLTKTNNTMVFYTGGRLPNSNYSQPEHSPYFGDNSSSIVAIGVPRYPVDRNRYLGIAAGGEYDLLNTTQCHIEFKPSRYNVSVGIQERNITVHRIDDAPDIDPSRNLTQVAIYQIQQVSTSQTTLYVSTVGDALNSSITNYILSNLDASLQDASLAGIKNSITAMIDDILTAYASAQLMIADDKQQVPVSVKFAGFRLGQNIWIIAVFAVNTFVLFCVIEEAVRTRMWRALQSFDIESPADVIIATSATSKQDENEHQPIVTNTDTASRRDILSKLKVTLEDDLNDGLTLRLIQAATRAEREPTDVWTKRQ